MSHRRLTLPEVLPLALAYPKRVPSWGNLHAVMYDRNVADKDVQHAARYACARFDAHGLTLALLMGCLTRTQRMKLPGNVARHDWDLYHGVIRR